MPRLRVLTTCPAHPSWVPGQVVDVPASEAGELVREGRAELVRFRNIERATEDRWRRSSR